MKINTYLLLFLRCKVVFNVELMTNLFRGLPWSIDENTSVKIG